jgi:hypothetical protein
MPPLTEEQRSKVLPILAKVREELADVSDGDRAVLHQMRRYVAKRLEFDERGTPTERRKLHELKWKKQRGLCAICEEQLPERGSELDRIEAIEGYTEANTRLLHHDCHRKAQEARGFA